MLMQLEKNINPLVIKSNEESASLSNQDFQKKVQNALKMEGNKVKCANSHLFKVSRKSALIRIRYNETSPDSHLAMSIIAPSYK